MGVSRNSRCLAVIATGGQLVRWDVTSDPVGLCPDTKSTITETPLTFGVMVVAMSDGNADAGLRQSFDILATIERLYREHADAQTVSSTLMKKARALHFRHPAVDMSVVCFAMRQVQSGNEPRRLMLVWPAREILISRALTMRAIA